MSRIGEGAPGEYITGLNSSLADIVTEVSSFLGFWEEVKVVYKNISQVMLTILLQSRILLDFSVV